MLRLNVFSQLDSKRLGFRGGYMAQKGKKGRIFGENPAGFTLVEILLVFGVLIVISLYASVALVSSEPRSLKPQPMPLLNLQLMQGVTR